MKIENEELLKLFRTPGPCEICRRRASVREGHHLRARGFAGGHRIDFRVNLIALGSSILRPSKFRHFFCHCHKQAQELKIEPARVLEIVAAREACTPEEITELMDWTSRLIKPTDTQLRDALTDLSPGAMAIALRELKEAGRLSDYNQHQNERTK